jgi:predicted AAA+ superfamily ATPase
MLKRKLLSKLKSWKERDHLCLVLKGQRQVGKTTIAEYFGKTEYSSCVLLDMYKDQISKRILEENEDVDSIIDALSLYKGIEILPKKTLIIIDEIQESTRARSKLRLFSEDGRYDVIATGSMLGVSDARLGSFKRSENPDLLPVGSEEHLEMYPMDFEEFLLATGVKQKDIDRIREKIISGTKLTDTELQVFSGRFSVFEVVGGMPAAVSAFVESGVNAAMRVLDSIISTCVNDINRYNAGVDAVKTQECFDSIPRQLSNTNKRFMYSRIDNGGSRSSGEKYMENLFWIKYAGYGLFSYALTGLRRPPERFTQNDVFKVYLSDTGLLMNLMGPESQTAILSGDTSFDFGAVTENMVMVCLQRAGYRISYYRRTSKTDKIEIDGVIDCGGLVCIEVKTGAERSYPSLIKTLDDPNVSRRIIFEKGNVWKGEDGIEHYPLFAAAFLFPENQCSIDESLAEGTIGNPFPE